jgi:peptidoglycan/xylan/chitin deacetylase (PgdA/CDA1 family)
VRTMGKPISSLVLVKRASRWASVLIGTLAFNAFAVEQDKVPFSNGDRPREIHNRIQGINSAKFVNNKVALTLDACSGAYDDDLVQFLIRNKIPTTLFVTKRWLDRNPEAIKIIKEHLDLFDIQNHGENHIPAVIGAGRQVYGIKGEPDIVHLRQEVQEGARAIEQRFGVHPHWYRGATAVYDQEAAKEIRRMGYDIAGFSVNADAGATLKQNEIVSRLRKVKGGDVIIAHMNKPAGKTAESIAQVLMEIVAKGLVFVRLDQVQLQELTR